MITDSPELQALPGVGFLQPGDRQAPPARLCRGSTAAPPPQGTRQVPPPAGEAMVMFCAGTGAPHTRSKL